MPAPKAFKDFLAEALALIPPQGVSSNVALVPTDYMRACLGDKIVGLPTFEFFARDLPEKNVAEVLRRSGVLDEIVHGTLRDPETAWERLRTELDHKENLIALLHLDGIAPVVGEIQLEQGFKLKTFSEQEWTALNPRIHDERVATEIATRQVFLVKHSVKLIPTLRFEPKRTTPVRDPLWDDWWLPLLGIALYRCDHFSDGVRLEVDPAWRIKKRGSFSDFGDEFPWDEHEDSPEVWQPYRSSAYRIDPNTMPQFMQFVRCAMRAARRASDHLGSGDHVRLSAKRFLGASFRLASHGGWRRDDQDTIEELLFNLARAGDGLFCTQSDSGEEVFVRRVAGASGLVEVQTFLRGVYDVRSKIAHGEAEPTIPDLSKLHEVIRFAFTGFLGLFIANGSLRKVHDVLDAGAPLPEAALSLQRDAIRGSRDPGGLGAQSK